MTDKIKEYLQTAYPSYNWADFGNDLLPQSPYGVIKTEKQPGGRGLRIILHRDQGQKYALEDDMRNVISLLKEYGFTSRNGNYNQLGKLVDYVDVGAVSDDNTISMEALFLMPTTSF